MKALKSVAIISALAASSCGGGIESKQDAANALGDLMLASQAAQQSALLAGSTGLTQNFTIGSTVTVQGKSSGSATVRFDAQTSGSAKLSNTIVFSKFSINGKTTFDGQETFSMDAQGSGTGGSASLALNGDLTVSGRYNASMKCDVTMTTSVTSSATGASSHTAITGSVKADDKTYSFDGTEQFSFGG